MKKYILPVMLLLLCTLCLAACVATPVATVKPSQQSPTGGNVVSVYDEKMNLVGKFSYQNPTENSMDVSQFQKTGYKFEGIYDMNRDIMLFNENGFQVPTVMLDTDFTAVLKYSPVTYQLVFQAQEGQLENSAEYIRNLCYGEVVSLFPTAVLEGKELDGWFDESGNRFSFGTNPVYTKFTEEGFVLSGEIIKLHARYTTKYCDVRLMFQDGTDDLRIKVEYGQRLPDLTSYLKDDGSRAVMGFGVSPNASEAYDDVVYTDLDLYALWKAYKTVNFVYTSSETKTVKIYQEGNLYTLPDGERIGYNFDGWYTSALLSGNKTTSVPFGSLEDTYYAKWSVANYTIQFVADGNLVGSSTFNIENTNISLPAVPQKAHYTGKWETYTLEFKDMIVNAVYEPEEMTLTLMSGTDYFHHSISYGEMYELPVPVKKGHNFNGWYYKGEKLTGEDGKSLRPYTFDEAVTMTAEWTAITCTLYFETNGGGAIEPVGVEYGKAYELTQVPERNGFFFAGWFDESTENEYIGSITLTKDTTVYAKWIKSVPIYDAEDLKKIADNPYGNYHLMTNINLKGEDWTPIPEFSGILNGNGYKIYNFNLRQNSVDLGFVVKNIGTIKNVTFANVELASTVDAGVTCSIGIVCAHNTGNIINVHIQMASVLVNVTGNAVNQQISGGCIAGENSGLLSNCSVQSDMVIKENVRGELDCTDTTTNLYIGGVVGKNTGTITTLNVNITMLADEYLYAYPTGWRSWHYAYKRSRVHIGGISGEEYGQLSESKVVLQLQFWSNAGASGNIHASVCVYRDTYIGGIVGSAYETSTITNCYAEGSMELKRVGSRAENDEFTSGGIVGSTTGGVNNSASVVDLTLKEGFGGFMGGIAGWIRLGGKVSNVACYGEIKVETSSNGYFAGLAGKVSGMLTKGYFHSKITTTSTNKADIAGYIDSSGSVSKTIGNGGTRQIYALNEGAVSYNYIINLDYDSDFLFDSKLLFEELCLFDADVWGIDEETGLYLIAFPENAQ